MQLKNNHLWEIYRKGDKSAFEQIYFNHVNMLYDYGVRITTNKALVEDCIQDLFSDLWEKKTQMGPVHSLKSYLLVSLRRRIIRNLTTEKHKNFHDEPQELCSYPQDFNPDLFGNYSEERLNHLAHAFTKLSDKQKEVIYLRFYNQLSYEEIAEVMSVQVKAIYKLTARAIEVLRMHIRMPMLDVFIIFILAALA